MFACLVVLGMSVVSTTLAFRLGRRDGRGWIAVYCGALAVAVVFATIRWVPVLEFYPPFSWLLAGQREFVLMLICGPGVLAVLIPKLKQCSVRFGVTAFVGVVVVYFTLPFALPAAMRGAHQRIQTQVNLDGVCIQTTSYTCGPASAVTALRQLGVEATEGEIAVCANTNPFSGTQPESLCRSLNKKYPGKIECHYSPYRDIRDVPRGPCVVVIRYSFMVDHFVALLAVSDKEIVLGDPVGGKRRLSHDEFRKIWRGTAISFRRPKPVRGQNRCSI